MNPTRLGTVIVSTVFGFALASGVILLTLDAFAAAIAVLLGVFCGAAAYTLDALTER